MKSRPRMPPNADVRSIRIAVDSEIPQDHAANAAKPTAPIVTANLSPCARTYCDLEGFTTDRLRNDTTGKRHQATRFAMQLRQFLLSRCVRLGNRSGVMLRDKRC